MGKHRANDKKNGTESRENLGQIECIKVQTGAIVNPFPMNSVLKQAIQLVHANMHVSMTNVLCRLILS